LSSPLDSTAERLRVVPQLVEMEVVQESNGPEGVGKVSSAAAMIA
jgi:hypothetical protein